MLVRPVLLVLLLAGLVVPAMTTGPASAAVLHCAITYTGSGGDIRPGPDAGKDHSWQAWNLETDDVRAVTDLDMSVDLQHPTAQDLKVHLMGPQLVGFEPNVMALAVGQVSGSVDGPFSFDDEARSGSVRVPQRR